MQRSSESDAVVMLADCAIDRLLGTGQFFQVYRGVPVDCDGDAAAVALKVLKPEHCHDSSVRRSIEREVRILRDIVDHPHVIKVFDVVHKVPMPAGLMTRRSHVLSNKTSVVVSELAARGELFDIIMHTGKLGEPLARCVFRQLVEGMLHLHSCGVAHRDLKAEQLLLDDEFRLKIADFGFAYVNKHNDGINWCTKQLGTSSYMAPEVFNYSRCLQGYDPMAADVWTIGLLLFLMVAGFPAVGKPSVTDAHFSMIKRGRMNAFWKLQKGRGIHLSPSLRSLIGSLLQCDPRNRPSLEQVLESDWMTSAEEDKVRLTDDQYFVAMSARYLRSAPVAAHSLGVSPPTDLDVVRAAMVDRSARIQSALEQKNTIENDNSNSNIMHENNKKNDNILNDGLLKLQEQPAATEAMSLSSPTETSPYEDSDIDVDRCTALVSSFTLTSEDNDSSDFV